MKPGSQGASCGGETESKRPRFAPVLVLWSALVGVNVMSAGVLGLRDLDIGVCCFLLVIVFQSPTLRTKWMGIHMTGFWCVHQPCVIRSVTPNYWPPLGRDQAQSKGSDELLHSHTNEASKQYV